MSQEFDPYFKWLKIPPSEQPPNHYRLLNTARFESDPEIIENAVSRLVVLLQNVSSGDKAEYAQRILNDVATARLCLSDPKRKLEYDELLRKQLYNQPARKVSPDIQPRAKPKKSGKKSRPGLKGTSPAGMASSPSRPARKTKRKKSKQASEKSNPPQTSSSAGLMIGYTALMVVVAGVALFFLVQKISNGRAETQVAAVDSASNDETGRATFDEPVAEPETNQVAETELAVAPETEPAAPTNPNQSGSSDSNPTDATPTPPPSSEPASSKPDQGAGNSAELLPDQLTRFEKMIGEFVEFEGVPVSANASKSGKTLYLRFSQDWDESIMVFMLVRDVGDDLSVEKLQEYAGKTVRVSGVVTRQLGSKRIGVKIQAKDQIEFVE